MEISLHHRIVDGIAVLDVAGELDIYTSPKFQSAIEDLMHNGHSHLVINLQKTSYLDSTALSVLSSALKQARGARGNLGLIYNQPEIEKIFTITGLHEIFPVFRSEVEALNTAKTWRVKPPRSR